MEFRRVVGETSPSRNAIRARAVAIGATVALGLGLTLAVYGGSSSAKTHSTSPPSLGAAASAQARAAIAAAERLPAFTFHGAHFNASRARGKTIFNIPLASTDPYVVSIDQQMKTVADGLGIHLTEYTNQGTPAEWAAGIEQAIATKANLIVLEDTGPESLLPQLRAAKQAGIPVLVVHYYENGSPIPAVAKGLVSAMTTAPFTKGERLVVDFAALHAKGLLHPLIITDTEFPISAQIVQAMKQQLKALCASCSATILNVPIAQWSTGMQSAVQSALIRDPAINYILPIYDSMSVGVNAAIVAAGKTGQLHIASFNGTPAIMKLIEQGSTLKADVGENTTWIAWAAMDQAMRLLTGVPAASNNEGTPVRLFNASNITQSGTPPAAGLGYGSAYVAGYDKIWGVNIK